MEKNTIHIKLKKKSTGVSFGFTYCKYLFLLCDVGVP